MDDSLIALMDEVERQEPAASERLLERLYAELHRIDGARFPTNDALSATPPMRALVIDDARRRQTQKHGGKFELTADCY